MFNLYVKYRICCCLSLVIFRANHNVCIQIFKHSRFFYICCFFFVFILLASERMVNEHTHTHTKYHNQTIQYNWLKMLKCREWDTRCTEEKYRKAERIKIYWYNDPQSKYLAPLYSIFNASMNPKKLFHRLKPCVPRIQHIILWMKKNLEIFILCSFFRL